MISMLLEAIRIGRRVQKSTKFLREWRNESEKKRKKDEIPFPSELTEKQEDKMGGSGLVKAFGEYRRDGENP